MVYHATRITWDFHENILMSLMYVLASCIKKKRESQMRNINEVKIFKSDSLNLEKMATFFFFIFSQQNMIHDLVAELEKFKFEYVG